MIAEELRTARTALLLQFLKKLRHGMRIETGVIHDVGAQEIGFGLRLTRILQEIRAHSEGDSKLRRL